MFDYYGGISGQPTVVSDLQAGDTVGLDVVVDSRFYNTFTSADDFGMWSENLMDSKFADSSRFQQYVLEGADCGSWGYLTADVAGAGTLTRDCAVDLNDFAQVAAGWMSCTDPANAACDEFWK